MLCHVQHLRSWDRLVAICAGTIWSNNELDLIFVSRAKFRNVKAVQSDWFNKYLFFLGSPIFKRAFHVIDTIFLFPPFYKIMSRKHRKINRNSLSFLMKRKKCERDSVLKRDLNKIHTGVGTPFVVWWCQMSDARRLYVRREFDYLHNISVG